MFPLEDDVPVKDLSVLKEHELLHVFYMEAALQSATRTHSLQVNALEFTRDLLDASISIGRQAQFVVRLSDDIAMNCSPLRSGGTDWSVVLLGQSYVGSTEALLLAFYSAFASLVAACSAYGIDFAAVCEVCSGYLGQR